MQTGTVTLITGDRVTVTDAGHGTVSVRPGAGREHMTFLTQRLNDHLYVLPADGLSLIALGGLDRRLFDVTTLLSYGYGDIASVDLPLLVQYRQASTRDEARNRLTANGATVRADLPAGRSLAAREHKRDAVRFWSGVTTADRGNRALAAGIDRIWLDGKRQVDLNQSVPQIGAPDAWAAGYTGAGVTVAVLDTGVDATHPDLAGKIVAAQNFTDAASVDDEAGHGTHVASTIVGSGSASGGRYKGVAPDASLAIGKVCPDLWCPESAILAGMQWAAVDQRARVVNLSLGGFDTPAVDPLEEAVNTLTAQHGTLFVIAAGNSGPGSETLSSPASADAAVAVAAVDKGDMLASFSGRGPRVGDGAIKPDLAAPGVGIVAARARNGWIGDPVGDLYLSLSGTSMATPHVAGTAALLASRHPGWGPGTLKAALMDSARILPGVDPFSAGTGRVDAARAVSQQVIAEPGSLSMGTQLWPHSDDQPLARTLTYHNYLASPVVVTLGIDMTGPYGDPVPAGMFTLSATQLAVPAGSDAQVSVTADTRGSPAVGQYFGRVRASVDGVAIAATPMTLQVEPERYSVAVRHTDATGAGAARFYTELLRTDMYDERYASESTGTVTWRLPKAGYVLSSMVYTNPGTPDERVGVFAYPVLTVDRDMTIDLDARQAKPVRFSVPEPSAAPIGANVGFDGRLDWTTYSWQVYGPQGLVASTQQLGPAAPRDRFVGRLEAALGRADANGSFATSPYRYNLAWYTPGVFPTGFTGTARPGDLATVTTTYSAAAPGWSGSMESQPRPAGIDWVWSGGLYTWDPFPVPVTRTEYYMARDVLWSVYTSQFLLDKGGYLDQWTYEPTRYQAAREYRVRWNGAVIGPSSARPPLARYGDYLTAHVPMFSDGTPGHLGDGSYDTARTVLYRDGTLVTESTWGPGQLWAEVPSNAAGYRLVADVTRSVTDVSTRISAAWTFQSGYMGGDPVDIPLMTVRFSPALDDANTAPSATRYQIPLIVEGATDRVSALAVQVSYDDGGTWQPASLTKTATGWTAQVTHPAGTGHVSLRAQATDGRGNTVQQTIVRAYHIG